MLKDKIPYAYKDKGSVQLLGSVAVENPDIKFCVADMVECPHMIILF